MTLTSRFVPVLSTSGLEEQRRALDSKLIGFGDLTRGWSFGEGEAISRDAIAAARVLLLIGAEFELQTDVFPNLNGGCAVAFYRGPERVEVTINPDLTADLTHERGFGPEFDEVIEPRLNVTRDMIIEKLLEIQRPTNLWMLCASSISGTMTSPAGDFETRSTRTPPSQQARPLLTAEGGSQSSRWAALVPVTT